MGLSDDASQNLCQLDEQWFDLTKDILREALQITPVNNNQAFKSPPSSDALINFVNELRYPKRLDLKVKGSSAIDFVRHRHSNPYAERIWEEFTQSIHTFIDDKRNLAQHTSGIKKATLIVILSIQFTKMIIYHLKRKHKFHPRPDSPLHLPNEKPVLGYLKFSAKGTKREVFGTPIPGSLITSDIQEASYYQEYLANVAKHRRYLAGKIGSDPDSPASKPTKPARKPKSMEPKAPPRPSVSKPVTSVQPEPKSAPAKTQGKKHKATTDISDKPSKATKSRHGFVSKKRTPISPLKFVDESVAEDVPAKEPQVDADMQRALEESLKSMYDVPQGPLPPVVIREPETYLIFKSPKGKALRINTYSRGAPPHLLNPPDMMNLHPYAELGLSKSKEESQEVIPRADAGGQAKGRPDPGAQDESQARSNTDEQDEGQAGSNPEEQSEGQAGPDPGNAGADEQPMSSPVQMDEGFTTTAYPKVQKNLKLTVKEQAREKPSKADHDKATAKTEAESMVSVTIQQDMSSIPPMTSPIIDLTSRPESPKKSMNRDHSKELAKDLAEARKKKKKSRESPKMPPGSPPHQPPPPPAGPSGASGAPRASGSSQVLPPPPPPSSNNQESQSKGSAAPSSSKIAALVEYQAWITTDIRLRPSISLTPADLQINEDIAPDEQAQSSDDEDIRSAYIPKVNLRGSRPALSISKMKAAYYPDVGLEQMVPDQFWIKEECKYDIAAMYGISHSWFQRQRFYIDKHTSEGDRSAVRTHMRILSVVRIEVFSMYRYDYIKKIVLRRADLNEHVIVERDFKYLYPSDFEDLYPLNLQEDFQLGIESYQTQLDLTKPRWDATGFEYKHDYTIIDSSRVVTFRDRYE
nr:histone deacetylase 14 [Tanacetum cinerariifolium]